MRTMCLKLFMVFSLFFPAFYSAFNEEYKMEYYAVFTLAYGILLIYMLLQVWKGKRKKKQRFVTLYAAVLVLYNALSLYMNVKYLHWYGEQINNTIAFLFFLVLLAYENSLGEDGDEVGIFFVRCTVLSNVISILYFLMGYVSFLICNHHFYFVRLPEGYKEFRHYWIYSHKSDYALMLTGFIAVCIRFRKKFKCKAEWIMSMAVLLIALILTHSWTGYGAALFVLAGAVADGIEWKKFHFRKIYLLFLGIFTAVAGVVVKILSKERNLLNLGSRSYIWTGSIKEIIKNPTGYGYKFAEVLYPVSETRNVGNAHNVFLNAMLRFSIPVGLCFLLLILLVAVYSLWKARSFLAAGMWLGFFLLMNMDYALLSYEVGMFLFIIYLVCVYRIGGEERVKNEMAEAETG